MRPLVRVALVREYTYAYAAVSPKDGSLVWMLTAKMDTLNMSAFLKHVSNRYPDEFVMVVMDGASSHRSLDLRAPENIAFVRLPAYSPELNPAERLWEELREKEFANRVFDSLGAAIAQAARGLKRLERNSGFLQSLTGWDWILGSA
jgi:transposase